MKIIIEAFDLHFFGLVLTLTRSLKDLFEARCSLGAFYFTSKSKAIFNTAYDHVFGKSNIVSTLVHFGIFIVQLLLAGAEKESSTKAFV